jgi:hypothetical protein
MSPAAGYLDRTTRSRTNLTISTDTTVRALLFDGPTCVGVRATVGSRSLHGQCGNGASLSAVVHLAMILAPRVLLRIPDQIGTRYVVMMPDLDPVHAGQRQSLR